MFCFPSLPKSSKIVQVIVVYSFSISVLASDKGFFAFASCTKLSPQAKQGEELVALRGRELMKTVGGAKNRNNRTNSDMVTVLRGRRGTSGVPEGRNRFWEPSQSKNA